MGFFYQNYYQEIFFQKLFYIFILIEMIHYFGTSVKYSCIVSRLQSGLNLQPPDDCLLRSLGNQSLRYMSLTIQEYLTLAPGYG